jgi:TPR repeat protein
MQNIQKTVFLSYRRTNFPWALSIFQNLTQHGFDVFFDFVGIASGNFERIILESIKARAHFVVLLTPSALERCAEPDDWLRREIETAFATRRNIVPLMLEGCDFETPAIKKQIKGTLEPLKDYNSLQVPAAYFAEAMQRLRDKYLNIPLDAVLHAPSSFAEENVKDQQAAAGNAPLVQQKELSAQEWFELGIMEKNELQAVSWFRKAADAGSARAMTKLGEIYLAGRGGPDIHKVMSGFADIVGSETLSRFLNDVSEPTAVSWFRKAADLGDVTAMIRLGMMYRVGHGVQKDDAVAVNWFRKAADLGDVTAMITLGMMEKNDVQAVIWFRMAAKAGDATGMFYLGRAYEKGLGVMKDQAQAEIWYRRADDTGDELTIGLLKHLNK